MNCYCDEVDHELCWDGFLATRDDSCACCKETKQAHRSYVEKEGVFELDVRKILDKDGE